MHYPTIMELATDLHWREYRSEITHEESEYCKWKNWLVIFWASDDLLEFRWAINDEVWAWNWTKVYLWKEKIIDIWYLDDQFQEADIDDDIHKLIMDTIKKEWIKIEAIADDPNYQFFIKTDFQNSAEFEILEDGEKYCRGLVLDLW